MFAEMEVNHEKDPTPFIAIYNLRNFGCSMPATSVRTVDDRPTLIFKGAPDGAVLFVDGLNLGPANQYNGAPKALIVEPGTHTCESPLTMWSFTSNGVCREFSEDDHGSVRIPHVIIHECFSFASSFCLCWVAPATRYTWSTTTTIYTVIIRSGAKGAVY